MRPLEPSTILTMKGDLAVRLAGGADEIAEAQKLRYRVFYEELNARPDAAAAAARIDADRFDSFCDHLIVTSGPDLVGTYRLLRQDVAEANGGFYTQDEFDVAPLLAAHPGLSFLELGRSCVLKPFRTRPVVELLWQGIWNYVRRHRFDVMLGCASLRGHGSRPPCGDPDVSCSQSRHPCRMARPRASPALCRDEAPPADPH